MPRRALLALALLLLALPAAARSLVIEKFEVEVIVNPDGTLDVTETIQPRFTGSWNGIYRTIPVEYATPQGFNYTLFLDVQKVTDDAGRPLRHEVSRERHYKKIKIWVPGAQDATRTVVLTYRVLDALRFFEDHDELYWNVTGDEWEVPIRQATADILLPASVTGLRAIAFTGAYGSRAQDANVEILGSGVHLRTRRPLGFHEGLSAVIGWDKGLVHPPGAATKAWLFLRSNWPFFIPIGVFAAMFWLWYTQGRDPRRQPVVVQYDPPEGLSPAEAGTLVDNEAKMRDITATIVDLAARGYLVIEQKEAEHLAGLWSNKEYAFHLQKPASEWKDLRPHERVLLTALFEGGSSQSVELSQLQNHFYTNLPLIRDCIFDSLMQRNYYLHRPDRVRHAYLVASAVIGAVTVWGGAFFSRLLGTAGLTTVLTGIATAAIICGFGWFMPARTFSGTRTLGNVLGFEDFLARVEEDRFERVVKTPEMFEKFLPYAMALGVEKKWVRAFADIYRQPPNWYRGPYGTTFQPIYFVNDLDMMSSRAGSVMASAPRSAGRSGFGGGGFSGGGFGGGGGGGF